jgi:hypothetical protein
MKILFIGDIYSKSGRNALHKYLPLIKEKYEVDFTILNGENTTHGRGLSIKNYAEIVNAGVDFITLGNHFLDNNEICQILKNKTNIVRPLNIENLYDGDGSRVVEIKNTKVRITNLVGRVHVNMKGLTITNPFDKLDDLLDNSNEKIHIVDFHAEATGEKKSLAKYFDGRVSAILGTHTHVQTADNQVFSKGTAYISDVGYCGAYDSVLGVSNGDAIVFSKDQDFRAHTPAESDELEFSAVYLDIDELSGKTNSIKRIYITPPKQEIKLLD